MDFESTVTNIINGSEAFTAVLDFESGETVIKDENGFFVATIHSGYNESSHNADLIELLLENRYYLIEAALTLQIDTLYKKAEKEYIDSGASSFFWALMDKLSGLRKAKERLLES